MRENRTYGLTRGRSGSAASLYSTRKPLLRKSAGNPFCGNLRETPSAEICGKPLLRKSAGNPFCGNLQETPSAEICGKPPLRKSAGNLLCGNLRETSSAGNPLYVNLPSTA
jgi:hypothetical protein